jgi:hypothetical protein
VLVEGLTEADMPALPDKVAQLREAENHQPALREQLAEVRRELRGIPKAAERHKLALALELYVSGMLADHRVETLKMGLAIRLLMSSRLDAVLPLDDGKLLDAAGPILPGGKQDPAAIADREAAMVKKAMAASPVAVIICGGSHDLSAAVLQADQTAEYIRVVTRGYLEATRGGGK